MCVAVIQMIDDMVHCRYSGDAEARKDPEWIFKQESRLPTLKKFTSCWKDRCANKLLNIAK